MQIVKTQLLGLCLLALLGFNRVAGAATLFPHRTLGWNKILNITVLGQEGDSRNQLIVDASISGINSSPRSAAVLS